MSNDLAQFARASFLRYTSGAQDPMARSRDREAPFDLRKKSSPRERDTQTAAWNKLFYLGEVRAGLTTEAAPLRSFAALQVGINTTLAPCSPADWIAIGSNPPTIAFNAMLGMTLTSGRPLGGDTCAARLATLCDSRTKVARHVMRERGSISTVVSRAAGEAHLGILWRIRGALQEFVRAAF